MEPTEKLVQEVLMETLQDFAFLFVEAEGDGTEAADEAGAYFSATVLFQGAEHGGSVFVAMPFALCLEMAANVLGEEAGAVPVATAEDAIKEWANIVAGTLTAKLYGVEKTFALSPPVAGRMNADAVRRMVGQPGVVWGRVDDRVVVASLKTN